MACNGLEVEINRIGKLDIVSLCEERKERVKGRGMEVL
jgi:hypothetical protein